MMGLLLAALVVAGLYFWWGLTGVQPLHEKALKFAEVRQVTMRDTISATGKVEPREIVLVSTESPGTILAISKDIGDTVLATVAIITVFGEFVGPTTLQAVLRAAGEIPLEAPATNESAPPDSPADAADAADAQGAEP